MDLDGVQFLGVVSHEVLKIGPRYSGERRRLCLGCSVGMAILQQLQQPALRDCLLHFPRPKRRRLSIARDLGGGVSPGAVAFDRAHQSDITAIGITGFAHPSFGGEYVSVHPPATKAIPQRRACRSLCTIIRPIRRNVENLTIGHTLKYRMDLSDA